MLLGMLVGGAQKVHRNCIEATNEIKGAMRDMEAKNKAKKNCKLGNAAE